MELRRHRVRHVFGHAAEDWVLVPIGSGNAEKEAFVEKISYVLADEVPVELTKLKKVIQKLDLVTVRYDVRVVRKGFLSFSGMAFDGPSRGERNTDGHAHSHHR